jgi:tryptophan synthase alpha chain
MSPGGHTKRERPTRCPRDSATETRRLTPVTLMATRIQTKFQQLRDTGKKAFIPYLTLGDPSLEATCELVMALERAGADIVELGVPFSDPLADGPVIQRATERSLSHGFRLKEALPLIRQLREETTIPLLLFSYYNPLFAYGFDTLARDARESGIDGFLITDLSVEEAAAPVEVMQRAGLDSIFLVAPTSTDERIQKISRYASGFIYAISRIGVTGMQDSLSSEITPLLKRIRQHSALPVVVGFGISRPEQVREVEQVADGVVVGSAIVLCIEENRRDPHLPEIVSNFARWLKGDP